MSNIARKLFMRKKREFRRENGLCYKCGEPLGAETRTTCQACHDKRNAAKPFSREKRRASAAKALGLCIFHPNREAVPGRTLCDPCLEKHSEDARRCFLKKREIALENGKCTICFNRDAPAGFKSCLKCRVKNRLRGKKSRRSIELAKKGLILIAIAS